MTLFRSTALVAFTLLATGAHAQSFPPQSDQDCASMRTTVVMCYHNCAFSNGHIDGIGLYVRNYVCPPLQAHYSASCLGLKKALQKYCWLRPPTPGWATWNAQWSLKPNYRARERNG